MRIDMIEVAARLGKKVAAQWRQSHLVLPKTAEKAHVVIGRSIQVRSLRNRNETMQSEPIYDALLYVMMVSTSLCPDVSSFNRAGARIVDAPRDNTATVKPKSD
jgi:hypothetical protein